MSALRLLSPENLFDKPPPSRQHLVQLVLFSIKFEPSAKPVLPVLQPARTKPQPADRCTEVLCATMIRTAAAKWLRSKHKTIQTEPTDALLAHYIAVQPDAHITLIPRRPAPLPTHLCATSTRTEQNPIPVILGQPDGQYTTTSQIRQQTRAASPVLCSTTHWHTYCFNERLTHGRHHRRALAKTPDFKTCW